MSELWAFTYLPQPLAGLWSASLAPVQPTRLFLPAGISGNWVLFAPLPRFKAMEKQYHTSHELWHTGSRTTIYLPHALLLPVLQTWRNDRHFLIFCQDFPPHELYMIWNKTRQTVNWKWIVFHFGKQLLAWQMFNFQLHAVPTRSGCTTEKQCNFCAMELRTWLCMNVLLCCKRVRVE